jgi:hypothetical protein
MNQRIDMLKKDLATSRI